MKRFNFLIKKNIALLCFLVLLIFSVFNISIVLANSNSFKLLDVLIEEKSEGVEAEVINHDKDNAKVNVVFHKLNDYVVYKLKVKNISKNDYDIDTIINNESNPYVKYEFDKHEDEKFSKNSTKEFIVKAIYNDEVNDLKERDQLSDYKLTIKFKDKESSSNPKTKDNIIIYIVLAIVSFIGLLILLASKLKNKKYLALLLLMVPILSKAFQISFEITFVGDLKLYDKMAVTINNNGKEEVVIVKYDEKITKPDDPFKKGYNFDGWYVGNKEYNFDTNVTNDEVIEAKYSVILYDITYDLDGGVANNPTTYNIESDDFDLVNPTKEGYSFLGWTGSNGSEYQTRVTILKGSTGDKNYKANYKEDKPVSYKVIHKYKKLDGSYEEEVEELEGVVNSSVRPALRPKTGFVNPKLKDLIINEYGSSELEYIYEREMYTLTLNNESDIDTTFTSGEYPYETKIVLAAKNKEGYTFSKWSNDETNQNIEFNLTEDTTIYPIYNTINYNISYDLNDGSVSESNPNSYNIESNITLNNPTKEGYTFAGWTGTDLDSATKNVTINSGSTGDRSYTATWTAKEYTISYDLNGGSVDEANPTTYTIESLNITLNNPTKLGYQFVGWTGTGLNATTMSVTINQGSTGNREYEANYVPRTDIPYVVNHKYRKLDGSFDTVVDALFGTTDSVVTPSLKPEEGFVSPSTSNLKITADGLASLDYIYERETYTLTLQNKEDIITSFNDESYPFETEITLTAKDKVGYNFKEWSNGNTNKTLVFEITEDTLLYPTYDIINYSINYDLGGGTTSTSNPTSYNVNSNITLNNPTKEGYTFAGWTGTDLDSATTSVVISSGSTGNRSYTATWTATEYTISYDLDGGSVSTSNPTKYTIESSNITLNNPTKDGYTFAGWTGTDLDSATTSVVISSGSTGNRTYTATWTVIEYTISYDLDGGSVSTSNPTKYTVESNNITLNNPTKEGYTFAGWTGTDLDSATTSVVINTGSTGNRSYTATWTSNSNTPYTVNHKYRNLDNTFVVVTRNLFGTTGDTVYPEIEPRTGFVSPTVESLLIESSGNSSLDYIYEREEYDITFDTDGGTNVSGFTRRYEEPLGTLPETTKDKHSFDGWFDGDDEVTETTLVTSDMTLTAHFTRIYGILCKKANTLHTETCSRTSLGCFDSGYTLTGSKQTTTITYGNMAASNLTVGDAYNCDVNDDGVFDETTERFYYLRTDDGNARFIYYSNFDGNGINNADIFLYVDIDSKLPTTTKWENVNVTFGPLAATIPNLQDISTYCNTNNLDSCNFVMENTQYHTTDKSLGRSATWLLKDQNETYRRIHNTSRSVATLTSEQAPESNNGVRPVIVVPLDRIESSHTIYFDAQGGSVENTFIRIDKGSKIGTLETPTKQDSFFDGWYTSAEAGTLINENIVPTGDTTYYARWKVNIKLAEILNENISMEVGQTRAILINNASEIGEEYTFASSDDTIASVDSNGVITGVSYGNVTITILGLTSNETRTVSVNVIDDSTQYEVSFDTDGGESILPIYVDPETAVGPLPTAIKTGYLFDGWFTTTDYDVEVTEETIIHDDTILYAKFTQAEAKIGSTYYRTLEEAVEDVPANDTKTTVEVLKNISNENLVVDAHQNIEFDFKTYSFTSSAGYLIDSSGTVLITNGTLLRNGTNDQSRVIQNKAGGSLTITGGDIKSNVFQVIRNYGTLNITGGKIWAASGVDQGLINNENGGTFTISGGEVIGTKRQAIYNDGGTLTISGDVQLTNGSGATANRACVQNHAGSTTIEGGIITSPSTAYPAVLNESTMVITGGTMTSSKFNGLTNQGTLTIGVKDGNYDISSPVIQGKTNGILATNPFNFYDGIIKGITTSVTTEPTTSEIEDNMELGRGVETIGSDEYQTLYLLPLGDKYTITLNPKGGTISETTIKIDKGSNVGVLEEPTKENHTFNGWYTEDGGGSLVTSDRVPTKNEEYFASWTYVSSNNIVDFDMTNDVMGVYYDNVDTWKNDSSTFQTNMVANFNNFNCKCNDGTCSTSGTVLCDKPKGYDTLMGEDVDVYLSNTSKDKLSLVTYTTSTDGVIYNMIPGQIYYWESSTDSNKYGYVRANGERRFIDAGNVRNVRDLGGLEVDTNNDGTVDGTLKYGKLFRGEKLWNDSINVTNLEKLGINEEVDLRKESERVSGEVKFTNFKQREIQHYQIDVANYPSYYNLVRNTVIEVMQDVIDGKNIYFHCRIGTDRTGTLAYILEGLLGVTDEERLEDYELSFFFGLINRHRFYSYDASSSVSKTEKFVYMYNIIPTNSAIYDWFMDGSSDVTTDETLIANFRTAMINSN